MVTKKKEVMSVLSLLIVLISITNTYATSKATEIQRGILPNWQNTSDITVALTINNEKAVLSTAIEGKRNVNKITAVALLERRNSNGTYTEIERWDNLISYSSNLDWTATRYVKKGYTYRFTIIATIYKDGVGETISGSKSTSA